MSWNNLELKTHCHRALEIGQLYLDKGLKQIAGKYAGRKIEVARKERNRSTEKFY